jgi:acyl-CoA synthetase (AMP-forming)/AMP-acid ligase II
MTMTRPEVVQRLTREGAFEVSTDEASGLRVFRHAPPSLRAVLETTRQFDDRTFLIYGDEEISYREHFRRVSALAHFLRAAGVKKGDRVAIGMRNYPEWVISFWACQAIGAIVVAINAWWTTSEISFALDDSTPAALLIDGERAERMAPLLGRLNLKALVVTRGNAASFAGTDFSEAVSKAVDGLPPETIEASDPATILYTSGTTGRPKGAVATHGNNVTNIMNSLLAGAVARGLLGDFSTPAPTAMPQGAGLQTFPFFHIGGLTGLYVGTAVGSKLALLYKWDPREAVDLIAKHKLSAVSGVPIVVRQLLEAARASGVDISSILGVASGGASVPPDLIRQIGKQFQQQASPANGYGLTETTSAVVTNSGLEYFEHPDSIGRPTPTTDVIIVDDAGRALADNEIGELWIRGPNVVMGYWKNPEATEAAFGNGWFRTGDLGYRDANGLHYVVDRKKDVIIRGGENVYCAEVEAALLEHTLVRDVAVVGLPDADYGEQVAAVVQVQDAARADHLPDELKAFLGEKLARFKIPTYFQLTEEELPRTATGKILKRQLRDMFAKRPGSEQ